jgi:hypothetical protein
MCPLRKFGISGVEHLVSATRSQKHNRSVMVAVQGPDVVAHPSYIPGVNLLGRREKYYLCAINPNTSFRFLIMLSSFKKFFSIHCMK